MRTQTEKTEQKRGLYVRGEFGLVLDSLNNEVINPEFQAVDKDLYVMRVRREYLNPREQELISKLKSGNKIKWGLC